jgi:signal transduction histidine kinase
MKNLLSNAIKFSDRHKNKPYVKVSVLPGETEAKIVVSDNGVGIQEKYLGDIFKMFYRGNDTGTGTGLGLYIVKEVVEKLGGTISVESYPGTGSSFLVTVPNLKKK